MANGPWTAGGFATVRSLDPSQPYLGKRRQFGGLHRGSAMTLFADGSVRPVRDTIDSKALRSTFYYCRREEQPVNKRSIRCHSEKFPRTGIRPLHPSGRRGNLGGVDKVPFRVIIVYSGRSAWDRCRRGGDKVPFRVIIVFWEIWVVSLLGVDKVPFRVIGGR